MQEKNARHVIAKEQSDCGNLNPYATKTVYFLRSDSKNRVAISTVTMELFQQPHGNPCAFQAQHLAESNTLIIALTRPIAGEWVSFYHKKARRRK